MTVATADDSNAKSNQATFLKVGQNLYRNESSSTYYGLTKRGGKQFRTALRVSCNGASPLQKRLQTPLRPLLLLSPSPSLQVQPFASRKKLSPRADPLVSFRLHF